MLPLFQHKGNTPVLKERVLVKEERVREVTSGQRMVGMAVFAVRRRKTQETRWWEDGIKEEGCPRH